jgi:hypothetical protein
MAQWASVSDYDIGNRNSDILAAVIRIERRLDE